MRIRKPIHNSPSASSSHSSSSSCTSYSYSSITNNSFIASSTDSSSTSSYSTSNNSSKCQGLDLLVKAIYQVTAGSVIGFPYIQKRVITRRRRRTTLTFHTTNSFFKRQQHQQHQRKRFKCVPFKFQDSVFLQPKSKTKRLSRSVKLSQDLGS